MNEKTRAKLLTAWQYCDQEDKSTEYMIQYMQDYAGVGLDTVIDFIQNTTDQERQNHKEVKPILSKKKLKEIRKISMEFCEPFYETFGSLDGGGNLIIDPLIGYLQMCGYNFEPMIADGIILFYFDGGLVFVPQAEKLSKGKLKNFSWIEK